MKRNSQPNTRLVSTHSISFRVFVAVASLPVLTAGAFAQSAASSYGTLSYSFALDANSSNLGQYLSVQDNGLLTYNFYTGAGPYMVSSGTGVASAAVNGGTYYDNSTWSGFSGASSSASESAPTGSAVASVGSQENLELYDSGTSSITLDISATGYALGSASVTGPTTASNFASVDTYLGIYAFDVTADMAISNPLVHISGNAATGVSTSATSDWTPYISGGNLYYSGSYDLTLTPGHLYALEFYTSGDAHASASTATPSPAAMLPMIAGLAGLLRRRISRRD
jgi:MYXO-CTERM domain-containing protein